MWNQQGPLSASWCCDLLHQVLGCHPSWLWSTWECLNCIPVPTSMDGPMKLFGLVDPSFLCFNSTSPQKKRPSTPGVHCLSSTFTTLSALTNGVGKMSKNMGLERGGDDLPGPEITNIDTLHCSNIAIGFLQLETRQFLRCSMILMKRPPFMIISGKIDGESMRIFQPTFDWVIGSSKRSSAAQSSSLRRGASKRAIFKSRTRRKARATRMERISWPRLLRSASAM